jgi:hypothetical protein
MVGLVANGGTPPPLERFVDLHLGCLANGTCSLLALLCIELLQAEQGVEAHLPHHTSLRVLAQAVWLESLLYRWQLVSACYRASQRWSNELLFPLAELKLG